MNRAATGAPLWKRVWMMANPGDASMSDDIDEKHYGLIEFAEQQQATAQMILEQLAEERAALAQERRNWTTDMEALRADLNATVLEAVSSNMAGVAATAAQTINGLGQPVADQMTRVAASAARADQAFRNMIGWASTRVLLWGLGALAGLVLLGWLASGIVLWWDTQAIATAHVAKQQLQVEVEDLRANRNAWVRAGMLSKLQQCGSKRQPCVAVDESAGAFGEQSDYRLLKHS